LADTRPGISWTGWRRTAPLPPWLAYVAIPPEQARRATVAPTSLVWWPAGAGGILPWYDPFCRVVRRSLVSVEINVPSSFFLSPFVFPSVLAATQVTADPWIEARVNQIMNVSGTETSRAVVAVGRCFSKAHMMVEA